MANVPLSEPTVIVVPELIVGRFVGNASSVPVGLLEKTSDPAPLLSVVSVPMVTPPITTSSELPDVAPVTLIVSFVDVVPEYVLALYVTEPVAELLGSVSDAVSTVLAERLPPPDQLVEPIELVPEVAAANVPLSEPTVTAAPAAILVGKFAGNVCCEPVGLLERAKVPAPVLSVVSVPIVTPPMATSSVLPAAAPLTLMVRLVVAVPPQPEPV